MVSIKGDIDKALGISEIQLKGITIDISDITAQDIIEYQKLIAKKYHEEDMRFTELNSFFIKILSKGNTLETEKVNKLVAINLTKLMTEFGIATGLLEREKVEQAVKDKEEELKKQ